jgi:molybdopterin-binding protein
VHLKSDELKLISRITCTSEEELAITLGDHLYAIIKASAPHVVREEVDKK